MSLASVDFYKACFKIAWTGESADCPFCLMVSSFLPFTPPPAPTPPQSPNPCGYDNDMYVALQLTTFVQIFKFFGATENCVQKIATVDPVVKWTVGWQVVKWSFAKTALCLWHREEPVKARQAAEYGLSKNNKRLRWMKMHCAWILWSCTTRGWNPRRLVFSAMWKRVFLGTMSCHAFLYSTSCAVMLCTLRWESCCSTVMLFRSYTQSIQIFKSTATFIGCLGVMPKIIIYFFGLFFKELWVELTCKFTVS